ncbi:hypothetical protein [Streptomyces californicus]|uniref:hypothetical protein n=1 Tax=Streptomyces californicus TaxID=67351 RepID=UPI0004BF585F|nr:hypothetical protein [Streptomyces californicus]QRV59522.1 hypothetical protein I6J40_35335 [Streptomyces californicus]
MSRTRPGRVRTKRDNGRPPLLLSKLKPQSINLREGETRTIICPDCERWRRLMGETQLKIREHCARECTASGDAAREKHTHCPGSDQAVRLDISIEQWGEAMLAADSTATGRRSARQHYKPIPAPAQPVMRMSPVPTTPDEALTVYRSHLRTCRSSTLAARCAGSHRCSEGARLAALYAELEQTQPARRREARVEEARARLQAARTWTQHTERTRAPKKSLAKRSGTAVEDANNTCRTSPAAGGVSGFRGPQIPLGPQNQQAHDQRRAALGRQYARV